MVYDNLLFKLLKAFGWREEKQQFPSTKLLKERKVLWDLLQVGENGAKSENILVG